jgi:hypothetical protein
MNPRKGLLIFKILIFVTIVVAGFGSAVLYLWNWLMPPIFGLPAITYWQALGLLGLSWLLFGGPRGFHGPHGRHCGHHPRHMSAEERDRFRAGMRSRWCHHGHDDANVAATSENAKATASAEEEPPPYRDFA